MQDKASAIDRLVNLLGLIVASAHVDLDHKLQMASVTVHVQNVLQKKVCILFCVFCCVFIHMCSRECLVID